jgi:hypothetical protein
MTLNSKTQDTYIVGRVYLRSPTNAGIMGFALPRRREGSAGRRVCGDCPAGIAASTGKQLSGDMSPSVETRSESARGRSASGSRVFGCIFMLLRSHSSIKGTARSREAHDDWRVGDRDGEALNTAGGDDTGMWAGFGGKGKALAQMTLLWRMSLIQCGS